VQKWCYTECFKIMDQFTDLSAARRRLDASNQPRHHIDIDILEGVLRNLGRKHPYSLTSSDYAALGKEPAYTRTCHGLSAVLAGRYCYRLSNIWRLLSYTSELLSFAKYELDEAWMFLLQQQRATSRWTNIGMIANGEHSGPRNLTWWTTAELEERELLCKAHRLGLPNDWIPERAIILRYPLDEVVAKGMAFVPTVVDAFDSAIFHASVESAMPSYGRAINLEDASNLTYGDTEFVMGAVPVSQLEVWAVPLDGNARLKHKVSLEDLLLGLTAYYQGAIL